MSDDLAMDEVIQARIRDLDNRGGQVRALHALIELHARAERERAASLAGESVVGVSILGAPVARRAGVVAEY